MKNICPKVSQALSLSGYKLWLEIIISIWYNLQFFYYLDKEGVRFMIKLIFIFTKKLK